MAWIIGDIHGCAFELGELLRALPKTEPLVFVGDYIDRGPDSAGVIELLLGQRERSVFLKGNHEDMLLAHMRDGDRPHLAEAWLYRPNGGLQTLQSYGLDEAARFSDLPPEHQSFLSNLPLKHEGDDFVVVHAGIRLAVGGLPAQTPEDLLWIRGDWLMRRDEWTGKKIYYGHTPTRYVHGLADEAKPIHGRASLGIDTGCVYGGYLTAANTDTGELVQIPASQIYFG